MGPQQGAAPPGEAGEGAALPSYEEALGRLAEEERGGGWLPWCEAEGIFQLPVREWVDALAAVLRPLGAARPLEAGAGAGVLGRALRARGLPFVMTDPQGGEEIAPLGASAALARHRPDLVLTCWLPFDAGGEAAILADRGVRWHLAVVQTGPGFAGSETLWRAKGWEGRPLPEVDRWSVSRADFLSEVDRGEHVRRGAAFLFTREAE